MVSSCISKVKQLASVYALVFVCLFGVSHVFAETRAAADDELNAINRLWQELLSQYATSGEKNGIPATMINYAGIKADPRLGELLGLFKNYPAERLQTNQQKIAFYLNAYNVLAIQKVVENWPIDRLKSLGSMFRPVWAHPAGEVCNEPMTLRKLEHDILRALGDARIHLALNCASMSCPDLRLEPYRVEVLEEQLQDQARIFAQQVGKGVTISGNKLHLSSIFDWFEDDFEPNGGVVAFLTPFLPSPPQGKQWEVGGYLAYDWDVNDHLSGSEKHKLNRKSFW